MPSATIAAADARLAEVGARQYGAFHRDQAVEAGLSRRQLDGRIASGRVQRRDHNAVTLAGWLTVHFTWRMIVHDPAYIVATVTEALRSRGFSW